MFRKKEIVVFVGPSISVSECNQYLDAIYLPPAQCGDILSAMRLKPKIIVLIDGNFEFCAAVWHKELLYALSQNIVVYGASSMGAIRAAELSVFGMRGFGKIFEWYVSGEIERDDEVALMHGPEETKYFSVTIPLVNLRATLEKVQEDGIATYEICDKFFKQASCIFYQERDEETLRKLCDNVVNRSELVALRNYFVEHGFVNQKRKDADDLLRLIASGKAEMENHDGKLLKVNSSFSDSLFFNKLFCDVMCRPFRTFSTDLPAVEKRAWDIQQTQLYGVLIRFAKALPFCYSHFHLEKRKEVNLSDRNNERRSRFIEWINGKLKSGNITNEELSQKIKYIFLIFDLYKSLEGQVLNKEFILDYVKNQEYGSAIRLLAYCWCIIDAFCITEKITPSSERIMRFSDDIRKSRKLFTQSSMCSWLNVYGMNEIDWFNLVTSYDRLTFFSDNFSNLLDKRSFEFERSIFWLDEAIELTGLELKKLL